MFSSSDTSPVNHLAFLVMRSFPTAMFLIDKFDRVEMSRFDEAETILTRLKNDHTLPKVLWRQLALVTELGRRLHERPLHYFKTEGSLEGYEGNLSRQRQLEP